MSFTVDMDGWRFEMCKTVFLLNMDSILLAVIGCSFIYTLDSLETFRISNGIIPGELIVRWWLHGVDM